RANPHPRHGLRPAGLRRPHEPLPAPVLQGQPPPRPILHQAPARRDRPAIPTRGTGPHAPTRRHHRGPPQNARRYHGRRPHRPAEKRPPAPRRTRKLLPPSHLPALRINGRPRPRKPRNHPAQREQQPPPARRPRRLSRPPLRADAPETSRRPRDVLAIYAGTPARACCPLTPPP